MKGAKVDEDLPGYRTLVVTIVVVTIVLSVAVGLLPLLVAPRIP
jgi:hypothetical protein